LRGSSGASEDLPGVRPKKDMLPSATGAHFE
jgi:hypothetical protein